MDSRSNKPNIVIQVPRLSSKGGVAFYYRALQNIFILKVEYCFRGSETWPHKQNIFSEIIRLMKDSFSLAKLCSASDVRLVVLNSNNQLVPLIRDCISLGICKLFSKKCIFFIHGWHNLKSTDTGIIVTLLKVIIQRVDSIIVLSKEFEQTIRTLGYRGTVFIETTLVDEKLISDSNLDAAYFEKKYDNRDFDFNILFLSRVEVDKGIYETIDCYDELKGKYPKLKLSIAGIGFELENVQTYIRNNKITEVNILGFVDGVEKQKLYLESDIFILPSYSEGMPLAILEAMAFGLPVISSNVGGLNDILSDGKTGYKTDRIDSTEFVRLFEKLFLQSENLSDIAKYNFKFAKDNFYSSSVVKRLEKITMMTINNETCGTESWKESS